MYNCASCKPWKLLYLRGQIMVNALIMVNTLITYEDINNASRINFTRA